MYIILTYLCAFLLQSKQKGSQQNKITTFFLFYLEKLSKKKNLNSGIFFQRKKKEQSELVFLCE